MKRFHCTYCQEEMETDSLAFKSNSYCNNCFEERAGGDLDQDKEVFVFNGIEVEL